MKKYLLLLWMLLPSLAAKAGNSDSAAIQTLLRQQVSDWNKGDIDGFMQGYWRSDSLMFIGKSGITYGWENTRGNYHRHYPDRAAMGSLQFTILQVSRLSPEYYEITGKWELALEQDRPAGYFTLLFRKIKGRWKIVRDHTSG